MLEADYLLREVLVSISFLNRVLHFFIGEVIEIWPKDFVGKFGVRKIKTFFDVEGMNLLREIESAIISNA